MGKNEDILADLELCEILEQKIQSEQEEEVVAEPITESSKEVISQQEDVFEAPTQKWFLQRCISSGIFFVKYITTSLCIFWVLLVVANYSAYFNLAYSFLYADELERTKNSLIQSVAAASIDESEENIQEVNTFKQLNTNKIKLEHTPSMHSLSHIMKKTQENGIDLNINITPYENRIVIPKIWKNIPLVDITQKTVDGIDELNDIFMDELENGVIRYPGSGIPWENGNAFIFWHSSNFPWMQWEYNDVFSLLDHVVFDDEVVIYYGQEKYTYKIRTKNVISPGDVSVLKSDTDAGRSQITLMTCWPIGTTLNRLVLVWDLVHIDS